jgi:hypothetical protein
MLSEEAEDAVNCDERMRELYSGARAVAAPRPVVGRGTKPRAHWVQNDLAAGFEQVRIVLDQLGGETVANEMAHPAVASIRPIGIAGVQLLHSA